MAHRFLQNPEADGLERSGIPILCHSCLGDKPYIGLTKADFDNECKICRRPFTFFKWRPDREGKYKKTEICRTCSKINNVCQGCFLVLEQGQSLTEQQSLRS